MAYGDNLIWTKGKPMPDISTSIVWVGGLPYYNLQDAEAGGASIKINNTTDPTKINGLTLATGISKVNGVSTT